MNIYQINRIVYYNYMDKDDFALLKVMASNIETIKEELREMKDAIKSKVSVDELSEVKIRLSKVEEKGESLLHKWWFASGLASAVSYLISHLLR